VGPNKLCIVVGVCVSLFQRVSGAEEREREREKQSQQTREIAHPRLAIWD
jgi:hypothetical protein